MCGSSLSNGLWRKMKDKIVERNGEVLHESAGGFVFHKDDDRLMVALLVVINDKNRGLYVPKGHVQEGEELEAAARREIEEETGLRMDRVESLGRTSEDTYEFREPGDDRLHRKTVHFFTFLAEVMGSLQAENHPVEKFTVGWFDANTVEWFMPHQEEDFKAALEAIRSL